jgi:hypothetical protein
MAGDDLRHENYRAMKWRSEMAGCLPLCIFKGA